MLRLCLTCLLLWLGACTKAFTPRTIPACHVRAGQGELDRERSYHALLLALDERKYTIVGSDPPRQVEAEFHSSYKPDQAFTRWLINIAQDGTLTVQSIPAETRVPRKQERWFALLEQSTRGLQCRDLNWLLWEAQNRGLAPLASGQMLSELPGSSGAEAPPPEAPLAADAAAPPPAPQLAPPVFAPSPPSREVAERAAKLRHERGNIRLSGPIALLTTGIALGGGAIGLGQLVIRESIGGCDDEEGDACFSDTQLRNLGIGTAAMGVAMAGCVAAGATLLVRRLGRMRAIGRELHELDRSSVSFAADAHSVNLSLRGAF